MILFALILAQLIPFNFCKSITITWSTPDGISKPATGQETLRAIQTHLQALHLAHFAPRILSIETDFQIKLCPPPTFDPLVKEFTVPRISGYSLLYDHECIQRGQEGLEVKWGSKPKLPVPETPPIYGTKGLSVPQFIHKLYKQKVTSGNQIWLIDSESLRAWFTAPTLNYLASPKSPSIPPAELMKQINSMYGSIGEKDLKNMPQAIQGALLIALPDYTTWRKESSHKSLFNPTWWITRSVPQDKSQIINLIQKIIRKSRRSDQLVIIHHDPTTFNFEVVTSLAAIYGEKDLISSTRVLPKTFTTIQLLQFMQKAAGLAVDSRDLLGQMGLLATGFNDRVGLIQNHLPYTRGELVLMSLLLVWVLAVISTRIFYTQKHYNAPLHIHCKRFVLFTILAVSPILLVTPSMWPKYLSMTVFSVFEAGYEAILYGILAFYSIAIFATAILVLADKFKNRRARNFNEEGEPDGLEDDLISDTESIQLVPK